ncbi:MAG: 2'-5' RNA ligase family protein [Pseudomonadota bacterium]
MEELTGADDMIEAVAMVRYALWILLPPEIEATFREAKQLADNALGGLDFVPHLTLAGAFDTDFDHVKSICETELLTGQSAGTLQGDAVSVIPQQYEIGTTAFTALYLRCKIGPALHAIRHSLHGVALLPVRGFVPHISLYYGTADESARQDVLSQLPLPIRPFKAERFAIAREGKEPLQWDVVAEI